MQSTNSKFSWMLVIDRAKAIFDRRNVNRHSGDFSISLTNTYSAHALPVSSSPKLNYNGESRMHLSMTRKKKTIFV